MKKNLHKRSAEAFFSGLVLPRGVYFKYKILYCLSCFIFRKRNYNLNMLKSLLLILLQFSLLAPAFAWGIKNKKTNAAEPKTVKVQAEDKAKPLPSDLQVLIGAYPELKIHADYDQAQNDYKITFNSYGKDFMFYWADGRVLPPEELKNRQNFHSIIYPYNNVLRDPSTFTEEEIQRLREYGKVSSRKNAPGTPMFFFDAIYSSQSRSTIERHIVTTTFLGKPTRVHEKIFPKLKNVEKKILEAEKTSPKVKTFVRELKSAAAYHWREIDGTSRKSFHSLGIAIDVLPVAYHGGEVYWSWARDKNPSGWMTTPLKRRWMPPEEVIRAFESEGFIWGGYWVIWDNMHFEYHPELRRK